MLEATILLSPWNKLRKTAKGARYLLEFTLVMHLYGSCCIFVIMIARALKELVNGDHTISDAGEPPLKVYIISLMMPCVAISMVMDLKTLAPFALICNLYASRWFVHNPSSNDLPSNHRTDPRLGISRTCSTTATDDKIDKELSNVTDTIASVVKNDDITEIDGLIDRKLLNITTKVKIDKDFDEQIGKAKPVW
ncbi:unnamed protein product [Spodoptera littoralis]|uniref:Uncharacterized protein n=1 Tax=Spodoptera littoralis TaxID=7109 RepID=A0A9P0IAY2_SPOLI|nr:unnamed protein product [Spodoptera littoralis]CAH1642540.1 unnamed protein product [Spodoptera littoralis]